MEFWKEVIMSTREWLISYWHIRQASSPIQMMKGAEMHEVWGREGGRLFDLHRFE
jgi:hypothetical protein